MAEMENKLESCQILSPGVRFDIMQPLVCVCAGILNDEEIVLKMGPASCHV
ncbi:MAG: hypothetical protein ACRD8Z_03880 [Nitrososphaeraceae archaeon]